MKFVKKKRKIKVTPGLKSLPRGGFYYSTN